MSMKPTKQEIRKYIKQEIRKYIMKKTKKELVEYVERHCHTHLANLSLRDGQEYLRYGCDGWIWSTGKIGERYSASSESILDTIWKYRMEIIKELQKEN